ncbi:hypothetical protein [Sinorhizobium psoraleae]|uniref:Uncharacterized protein n=1 Tax=Sinorhizobium psoraleae TaxID=520838 RepID=A0ABT4KM77_9HYPH|nr:hypothetical protein [Sinorhizobium psoraleae]MCZ4093048.1 hypothetical protein [Sinorhizobium psoraleae]
MPPRDECSPAAQPARAGADELERKPAEGIPLNLGNYAQSEEYQLARDAGRDFLATILRKDTGAAITAQEEQIYGKMFLPQPGDKPKAIQAKRQRRALAVEAIQGSMPATAIGNMAKARCRAVLN